MAEKILKWGTAALYVVMIVHGYVSLSVGWRWVIVHVYRYQSLLGGLATLASALLIVWQIQESRRKARQDVSHLHKPEFDALDQISTMLSVGHSPSALGGGEWFQSVDDALLDFARNRTTPDIVKALQDYSEAVEVFQERQMNGTSPASRVYIDATTQRLQRLVHQRVVYLHDVYIAPALK